MTDATVEDVVQDCGYATGRSAGSVTLGGPIYSESIPPADAYGTLAWSAPGGREITLADLQAVVNNAARNGGGWVQIVGHKVCSQAFEPAVYTDCMSQDGPMELTTLNAFLDWMANRGSPGGAPAGTVAKSVAEVLAADQTAPTSSIACNGAACSATPYASAVNVTLSAVDTGGAGVASIRYTTDGSTPTLASPAYTGAFSVPTTRTVKFFAVDRFGNAEAVRTQEIRVGGADVTAPTTTISCGGTACSTGWYRTTPVQVALAATDNVGGSGVAATYYTTNGSAPTTSSTRYTAPFPVSATTTVRFFSVDVAGRAEVAKSQLIRFDTVAPTSSITCNNTTCSTGLYSAPVQVALAATDNAGGSGVLRIHYTTNGSAPTTSSPVYTAPFTVTQTTNVRFFAVDVAGNAEVAKAQNVRFVDTVAADNVDHVCRHGVLHWLVSHCNRGGRAPRQPTMRVVRASRRSTTRRMGRWQRRRARATPRRSP